MPIHRLVLFLLLSCVPISEVAAEQKENCIVRSGVVVQFDTEFAFENPAYNTELFHRQLDVRYDGFYNPANGDKFERHYFNGSKPWFNADLATSTLRTCWQLDGEPLSDALQSGVTQFRFGFGPITKDIVIPELPQLMQNMADREPDTLPSDERRITLNTTFRISHPTPTWFVPLAAKVVELADGRRVLRIRTHNPAPHEIRDVTLKLNASDGRMSTCISTPTQIQGTISIRQSGGSWDAIATNLEFGGEEKVRSILDNGPCGELDFSMNLGTLPPVQPNEDHAISYEILGESLPQTGSSAPFWIALWEQSIEFSGPQVWPRSLSVQQSCPQVIKEKVKQEIEGKPKESSGLPGGLLQERFSFSMDMESRRLAHYGDCNSTD